MRRYQAGLLALVLLLVVPAVARAENATVAAVLTNTVYTGSSLVDDVSLTLNNPPAWIFQQGGTAGAAAMTPGNNCSDVGALMDGTRIACGITGSVIFDLNGGADRVLAGETGHGMTFNGGAGNDFLSVGGDAINTINGGADDDTILVSTAHNQNSIDGGTGNDTIQYPVGPDLVNGGAGTDTLLYSTGGGTAVTVSLDDMQNDGKAGDLPANIHSDVENLTGGAENDTFTGSAASNVLIGNAGNDNLTGGPGPDTISGGDGNDTIDARDGAPDTIDCGANEDTANVDPLDTTVNCEHVVYADADSDGFNAKFDCNDHSAAIHPGAFDTPGDGIDQDCSGHDTPIALIDKDRDGSVLPADCNDNNAGIRPGAFDIPGNHIDENCDGHDATLGLPNSPITNRWLFGAKTQVVQLLVTGIPAGGKVKVTCKGKTCPFKSKKAKVKGGKAKLTSFFKHKKLKPGVRIDVTITAPNFLGKVGRFTIRRNKIPKAQTLCLRPGKTKPAAC